MIKILNLCMFIDPKLYGSSFRLLKRVSLMTAHQWIRTKQDERAREIWPEEGRELVIF